MPNKTITFCSQRELSQNEVSFLITIIEYFCTLESNALADFKYKTALSIEI